MRLFVYAGGYTKESLKHDMSKCLRCYIQMRGDSTVSIRPAGYAPMRLGKVMPIRACVYTCVCVCVFAYAHSPA